MKDIIKKRLIKYRAKKLDKNSISSYEVVKLGYLIEELEDILEEEKNLLKP